ncbi:ABC transporter ATP-binding protein [Permianibacter aggregans]|uniref:ABC-2 type transport system ATP-binding protein n=1 Tax=Permianibacter aggregans TaxID=1510150 RepID=A0A4R6UTT8_9GAMM|nr:ABC transporter ATP-binding protein [Permianibacter aggregans]TDQ50591.1 ABC-2 type transport system ATP-binding protein [Permianibacter aggregans]
MILSVKAVSKRYGDRPAVDNLSFALHAGEVFGLLGPNGAGKSTTCHIMTGLLHPDNGEIRVFGEPPTEASVRRRIGIAPQQIALYERLTARQNLQFFCSLYQLQGKTADAAIDRVLDLVGLRDRANDAVKSFSGGMLRRLNLAGALIHNPDIVLLDEPTAGVDPQSRNRLFETVDALKAAGKTIIYTTHYMEEAARLCDRVAIIDQGRLLALDSVNALLSEHGGPTQISYLHDGQRHQIDTPQPEQALASLLQQHADLSQLNVRAPTLESVFLKLTGKHLRD